MTACSCGARKSPRAAMCRRCRDNLRRHANPTKELARRRAQQRIPLAGKRCAKCGRTVALERHHPDIQREPDRIVILCRPCHIDADRALGKRTTWVPPRRERGPVPLSANIASFVPHPRGDAPQLLHFVGSRALVEANAHADHHGGSVLLADKAGDGLAWSLSAALSAGVVLLVSDGLTDAVNALAHAMGRQCGLRTIVTYQPSDSLELLALVHPASEATWLAR